MDAGAIDPFRLFLVFNELVDAEQRKVQGFNPAYVIDQSHNVTDPIENWMSSATEILRCYVQASLIDRTALAALQQENVVMGSHRALKMETKFEGKRDKRGDWSPPDPLDYAPVLEWPMRPRAILKWIFGYPGFFLPWNIFYFAVPIITWVYFTPTMEQMKTFQVSWISYIVIRNLILILLVAGAWHSWLYIKKAQGTDWKHTNKWLARDNPIFLFRNQALDNLFWTVFSAVPIWSAYEVITMWLYANNYIPYLSIADHPIYFCLMMCAIPLIRDLHFMQSIASVIGHRFINMCIICTTIMSMLAHSQGLPCIPENICFIGRALSSIG